MVSPPGLKDSRAQKKSSLKDSFYLKHNDVYLSLLFLNFFSFRRKASVTITTYDNYSYPNNVSCQLSMQAKTSVRGKTFDF